MKKKVKDLTLKEFNIVCNQYLDLFSGCEECPFRDIECADLKTYLAKQDLLKMLEQEIEVE